MSVIRNRYNAKNQFIILDQATTWNQNLSLKAVGLWARCISRPDNWFFNISEMASNGKEKEKAIYSAIRELKEANLCVFIQHRIKGTKGRKKLNRIFSSEYFFFQIPLTEDEKMKFIEEEESKFKLFLQDGGFVDGALVDGGKEALTNNYSTYIEGETEPNAADSKKSTHPNLELEKIGLTGNQYGKLKKEFGSDVLDKGIEILKRQPTFIDNPYGWLQKCIKEKWWEKQNKKDEFINKNKEISEKIVENSKDKLKVNSSMECGDKELLIIRGANIIPIPYSVVDFADLVQKELKKMNLMELWGKNGIA